MSEYTIGIAIQGIPGVYGFGRAPTGIVATWYEGALVDRPVPSLEGYDPDTGQVTPGRLVCEFNGRLEIRDALLAQATRPAARTTTALTADGGSVTLTSALALGVGDQLYLRNETLIVAGVSGATYTVLRGAFGSRPRPWAAGAFVWLEPPYWRRRYVELREYADPDSAAYTVIWRGFLDGSPRTSPDAARVILECSGPLALDADLRLNRNASVGRYDGTRGVTGLTPPYAFKGQPASGQPAAIQVGETLAVCVGGTAGHTIQRDRVLASPARPLDAGAEAREVLCVARGASAVNPLAVAGLPYPLHPLSLAAALLFSTEDAAVDLARYDVLSARWSCGFGAFATPASLAQITALIEDTRDLELDHVVLGWGGDSPVILPWLRALLLGFGFAIGSTADGGIAFVRAADAASYADELEELDPVKDLVEFAQSRGGINDSVSAEIGRLPWQQPARLSLAVQADLTDYPVEGETVSVDLGSQALWRADELTNGRLLSLAFTRQLGSPGLRLRLRGAVKPAVGQLYRLANISGLGTPIFRTVDNANTADLSAADFVIKVTHRRPLVGSRGWEIEGRLTSWPLGGLLRLRAPSATVVSVAGAAYTVGGNYGQVGQASATFAVGQRVAAWSPDGTRITDEQEIGDITGAVLTLVSALSPAPTTGAIIRLCDLSEQALDPRAWVWLGALDLYA